MALRQCRSVEGDGPGDEMGASLDGGDGYGHSPVTHGSALNSDRYDSPLYEHPALPGQQRPRRPKLQHSQSILRKQAEEEAIKRSHSLSESYELSTELQDKQLTLRLGDPAWRPPGDPARRTHHPDGVPPVPDEQELRAPAQLHVPAHRPVQHAHADDRGGARQGPRLLLRGPPGAAG
ncbi:hypothetical protein MATL_G00113800 [Megalops atlanticus]|uniref:Uncharacterized protein n=1 Tax=Megalops atlanticus TaxID=7932 RepID=A0A9D3Q1B9_MEGAT|nr:hypothetical protein MATL_G00113800 [Megalops atlanticus]